MENAIVHAMQESAYAIGQAVFLRTDTPDFAEHVVPFKSLSEMVELCSKPHPNLTLEKLIVYSMVDGEPCALMLNYMACTRGQKPGDFLLAHD